MSGEAVLIALIREDDALFGMLETLKAEELQVGDALNAIGLTTISDVDDRPIARSANRRVTERVQATVYAKDSTTRRQILGRLKRAASDQVRAAIAGVTSVTVISEGRGPNFRVEGAALRGGSIDFMVSYNEAA